MCSYDTIVELSAIGPTREFKSIKEFITWIMWIYYYCELCAWKACF